MYKTATKIITILCCFILALSGSISNIFANNRTVRLATQAAITDELTELTDRFAQIYAIKNRDQLLKLWSNIDQHQLNYQQAIQQILNYSEKIENIADTKIRLEIGNSNQATVIVALLFNHRSESGELAQGKRIFRLDHIYQNNSWRIINIENYQQVLATQLLAIDNENQRDTLLRSNNNFFNLELARLLYIRGLEYHKDGNQQQAERALKISLEAAGQLNSDSGYVTIAGSIQLALGATYIADKRFNLALEALNNGLQLTKDNPRQMMTLSRIYLSLGNLYEAQRDYQQALNYFQQSVNIKEQLSDERGLALLYTNMSIIYRYLKDGEKAYQMMIQSLSILERTNKDNSNNATIADICNNMGNYLMDRGDIKGAMAAYNKGLAAVKVINSSSVLALTYHNLGGIYRAVGNNRQSLKHYLEAKRLLERSNDRAAYCQALNGIGIVYQEQGKNRIALQYYQQSERILRELKAEEDKQAFLLHIMGTAYRAMGNYPLALSYYCESISLNEKLDNRARVAATKLNQGNLYRQLNQFDLAESDYLDGLNNSEATTALKVQLNNGMALLYEARGQYQSALNYAERAIELAEQLDSFDLFWQPRDTAGRLKLRLNRRAEARAFYQAAITMIEKNRDGLAGGQPEQANFLDNRLSPYQGMIRLLVDESNYSEALYYAELSRSRVLLDVLRGSRINIRQKMTPGQQQEETDLRVELNSLQIQLASNRESIEMAKKVANNSATINKLLLEQSSIRRTLAVSKQRLTEFLQRLYAELPQLQSQRGDTQPINSAELSNLAHASDRVFIEYVVTEDDCYLFLLANNKKSSPDGKADLTISDIELKVYRLELTKRSLTDLINRFRAAIISNNKRSYLPLARLLFEKLLLPAQAELQNRQELVIVPDNIIWQLPFAALIHQQLGREQFLIESLAISYAPSFTALKEMHRLTQARAQSRSDQAELLAFGNPVISPESFLIGDHSELTELMAKLKPLSDAEKLVQDLSTIYGDKGKYFTCKEATEGQFKSLAGNFRTILLATHGIIDADDPISSYLVLSKSGATDLEDGLLNAGELIEMELNAEIIVLSACDSGLGELTGGEGIIGLMWSVFVAGCPTTLVSKWQIRSDSTREFMLSFFKSLSKKQESNISKGQALRQASIQLINSHQYNSPYFWAAFSIVGDSQ